MSFREVKTFTEKMRGLGYPRPISMESFRTPNFELVADILFWLVKNYDPSIDVTFDISSEHDRIIFIKSIAAFMAPKAHIKLNTRKLYMADGYAVRELLKIADLLYEAHRIQPELEEDVSVLPPLDISNKISQLKTSRTLASEITEKGAELYDLLGRELELRETRTAVISRPFELETMERSVTEAINKLRDQITTSRNSIENLHADETNLMAKIDKKKLELDRAEKRLKSLQGVRPAYMDEYEKIEVDLNKLYDVYMDKFRNLTFLEQQLDEYNREEQDKFEETESSLRKMQNRLREEELRLLRGEKEMEKGDSGSGARSGRPQRPTAAGSRSRGLNGRRGSGSNMGQDGLDNDEDDEDEEDMDEDAAVSIGTGVSSGDIQQDGEDDDDDDDDDIFDSNENLGRETDIDGNDRNASARSKRPKRAGENGRSVSGGVGRAGPGAGDGGAGADADARRPMQARGGGLSVRGRVGEDAGRGRLGDDSDDDDDDDSSDEGGGLRDGDIDRDEEDDDDVLEDSSEDLAHGSAGIDDDNDF